MAATRRRLLRYPKTTQERRVSQDKHDLLIRPKRRSKNLPNAYDDYFTCQQKSWKTRRKTQYRSDKTNFAWFSVEIVRFNYLKLGAVNWQEIRFIREECERLGYYHEWQGDRFIWYGLDIRKW